MIQQFLTKKKATIKEIQKLTGFLNFLCRCIIPGRAFTRRFYALTQGNIMKPPHHVSLKAENRLDLKMWQTFLSSQSVFCTPFYDFEDALMADDVLLFSDASKNFRKGFGAWCWTSWTFGAWDYQFMCDCDPTIEYLELYAVTIAVKLWIHRFANRKIYLFCDSLSVVHMINHSSSGCRNCMVLIRIIVLESLFNNVRVKAKHVRSEMNGIADSLSRFQFKRFLKLMKDKTFDEIPTTLPMKLWLPKKIWLN